ncbi:hypothetical protein [Lacisediminihabitans profunda]|nr:hypothetical protein [Lacisediminihabitans profunda]
MALITETAVSLLVVGLVAMAVWGAVVLLSEAGDRLDLGVNE